jgi:hypothetical protein
MITRTRFIGVTLALAALGLAGASFVGWTLHGALAEPVHLSQAAWKEKFSAPSELARGVDVIAVARAVQARPGRIATSDTGEDSLPFEEVIFEVQRGVKGVAEGASLVVERAGGVDLEGTSILLDADGGPFTIGETYLLFLKHQEEGSYFYQVNDQGRFAVRGSHLDAVSPEDSVAGFLHGREVEGTLRMLEGYLHGRRQ